MSQREEILAESDALLAQVTRRNGKAHDETHIEERAAPVDLDRLIHGLQLRLASVASKLADKDRSDVEQLKLLAQTVGRYVGHQLKPLQAEIAALKAQVAELQERGVKFSGTYQRAQSYKRGEWVGHVCELATGHTSRTRWKGRAWWLRLSRRNTGSTSNESNLATRLSRVCKHTWVIAGRPLRSMLTLRMVTRSMADCRSTQALTCQAQ